MAYSSNPTLVEQRAHLFSDLAEGRAQKWHVPSTRAETLRTLQRLRETLYIAALYPLRFPALADAYRRWSLYMVQPGLIEARPKRQPVDITTGPVTAPARVEHGAAAYLGPEVQQVDLHSAEQLINSWNQHQPSSDPLLFQRTTLPLPELLKLHAWATRHAPKLMILVGDEHITLSLYEAEVASLAAWTPPPIPPQEEEFDLEPPAI